MCQPPGPLEPEIEEFGAAAPPRACSRRLSKGTLVASSHFSDRLPARRDRSRAAADAHGAPPVHPLTVRPSAHATTTPEFRIEPLYTAPPVTVPHRHDFAQVLFLEHGSGAHTLDGAITLAHAPRIFVISRGQLHHWRFTSPVSGRVFAFTDPFVDAAGQLPAGVRELVMLGSPLTQPDPPAARRIRRLFEVAAAESLYTSDPHGTEVIARSSLLALLVECARLRAGLAPGTRTSTDLSAKFVRFVLAEPRATLTVAECAARLGVTPGHLADAVSAGTGSSPGHVIRRALAREAQRLLGGTSLAVNRVASELEFSEPSYFSRFFRREVGCTPSEYRAGAEHHAGAARDDSTGSVAP